MNLIYHIVTTSDFNRLSEKGFFIPQSLAEDGFIHCSYSHQVCGIANQLYRNSKELLLLEIDKTLTECSVIDEDLYNLNRDYPHIYGKLPLDAIVAKYPFEMDSEGLFTLPHGIQGATGK
ncbi:MAG: DUF952 domain-containing protein [Spirochaetales bacterium]|nr:DUF952 domain-containing protein [Spirochaetales bacterium]